ncbi:MAG: hypothetical protein Q3962_06125 [Corynebacterium sp.]|nr:hypothetical protein [Corynebacterium sp.]
MQVGGNEQGLSAWEECAQLVWYFEEHYPITEDFDSWAARVPDRLTHAAMMQLGAARDHSLFVLDPAITVDGTRVGSGTGPVIRALPHPAWGPLYREMAWIPELATISAAAGVDIEFGDGPVDTDIVLDFGEIQKNWVFPEVDTEISEGYFGKEVRAGSGVVIATPESYRARCADIAHGIKMKLC